MAFGVYCHMKSLRMQEGMITHVLQKKRRFQQCPAYRHARVRWQNQESAHILSDSKSRVHFPQTVCHSRMTGYYAISRLVHCYDLVLKSVRSAYRLAISIWCCLLILHSVEQKWPAAVTTWPMTLGAVVVEDELLGSSWPTMYLLAP